jgi:chemotaxis protein methyltransferase CheR
MVSFARLNLSADSFPIPGPDGPKCDLIVCRNVTIYFAPDATQRLYRRFAEALAPDGWLVLGPSDPCPEGAGLFAPLHLPEAVLWRRPIRTTKPKATRGAISQNEDPYECPGIGEAQSTRGTHRPRRIAVPSTKQNRRSARLDSMAPSASLRSAVSGPRGASRPAEGVQSEAGSDSTALDCRAHLMQGMLHLDDGDLHLAIESLRRAAYLDADNPLAYFSLGRAYTRLGSPDRAVAALLHARRLLAVSPADGTVPGYDEISVAELSHAVELMLADSKAPVRA